MLVVFIGGMAIGAWLCGRRAAHPASVDRVCARRRPRRHRRDRISPVLRDGDGLGVRSFPAVGVRCQRYLHRVLDLCGGADPAAVDTPWHDVSPDDRRRAARLPRSGPGERSRCFTSSTASARCSACWRARFVLVALDGTARGVADCRSAQCRARDGGLYGALERGTREGANGVQPTAREEARGNGVARWLAVGAFFTGLSIIHLRDRVDPHAEPRPRRLDPRLRADARSFILGFALGGRGYAGASIRCSMPTDFSAWSRW